MSVTSVSSNKTDRHDMTEMLLKMELCPLIPSFWNKISIQVRLGLWYLTPYSTIFQLHRGCQFHWWWKPEKTTVLSQVTDKATGEFYHLRMRVDCTLFCNLQRRARTHAVKKLVKGPLYELLGNPTI
jgi:hypothetical protein